MMNKINGVVHGGKVFVNLTPYEVDVMDDGEAVRVPPSGLPGSGIPDPQDGIVYIASTTAVAEAARIDVVTPASCVD